MAVDGLTPYGPIERFSGIRLDVDPEELGFDGAMEALNVDIDHRGRLRRRFGTTLFTTTGGLGNGRIFPFYRGTLSTQILTANNSFADTVVLSDTGTTVATDTGVVANAFAAVGTPTASYVYFGRAVSSIRRWDGTSFTSPAGMPSDVFRLAVQPGDGRLAAAGRFSSTNPSRVQFSDAPTVSAPNAVETWGANNYVDLSPGDGENITGLVAWQNYLFAFKQSKLFVFYGNSKGPDGSPEFNKRDLTYGVGHESDFPPVAAPEGVYFVHTSGIYLTNGNGAPRKISQAIDPVFANHGLPAWYTGGYLSSQFISLTYHAGRLFVGTSTRTFVYDPTTEQWVVYSFGMKGAASFTVSAKYVGARPELWFIGTDGTNNGIFRFGTSGTTDNGNAITGSYVSGFSDMGQPAREKTIRETELVGSGTVSLDWVREFNAVGSGDSVSLGSTTSRGLSRQAEVGELLAFSLSSSSAFEIARLVPMIREVRGVGEKTS